MKQPAIRRLVAILVADVVGFSRHMERDDAGTLARLREIRESLFDPRIDENGGRIVKTTGDGMLVEFGSADASLRCAVDVQRAMAERNRHCADDDRIEFRIGINLGDIIVEGNDIFGDGVNVAARLEALATAGGICVSSAVRDQVHGSLDVDFVDAGEQQVKNIARPIRMYSVTFATEVSPGLPVATRGSAPAQATRVPSPSRGPVPLRHWTAVVVVVGAIGLFAVWWSARTVPPPVPPAASVAVMPLAAAAGDTAALQRAEPITREVTAMLARSGTLIRAVPVSAAQARTANDGPGATARTLDVRYLAEGDVRQSQEALAVDLRLVNGATGQQVWSESVFLKDADTPTERSRVLHAVVWHLSRALISAELRRVATPGAGEATPMDDVLRALALDRTEPDTQKRTREKEKLYEAALQRDPNLISALTGLVAELDQQIEYAIHPDRDRLVRRMDELTSKALRLNDTLPAIWFFRSRALMYMGQWNASLEASARAIRIEPYSSGLVLNHASLMTLSGRPAEALMLAEQAITMDPQGNSGQVEVACEAYLFLGQYARVVDACERAKGLSGENWTVDLYLAAAYGELGEAAKAAAARNEVLRLVSGYTIAVHKAKGYSANPEYLRLADERLYAGMRKAGFPEK